MSAPSTWVRRLLFVACAAVAGWAPSIAAQQSGASSAQKPAARKTAKAPARGTAPAADFDKLIAEATAARQAERWQDAIDLYKQAIKIRPKYVEGYWYQGTAYYSLQDYAAAKTAFESVLRLAPENGAAYAFVGLCEFALEDYVHSVSHLLRSRTLGVGDAPELAGMARYHLAVLLTRAEQFEQALETLGEFALQGDDTPRVIEAMGIATLRMPLLPGELPPDRREMVLMAGRGSYMMATRNTAAAEKAFDALAVRYPETANVHYARAVFLLQEQPDKAIEEFKRELQLQPAHPASLMQLAFEYLNRGDAQTALEWAKQAVAAAPGEFPAHKALGQALLETGDVDGAIAELKKGVELAPESPSLHFQLARAYQRAGRPDDATREREEFTRLDRLARARRSGPQAVGGKGSS
jgi:tetratricopeptide (TPR) repeat protein